MSDNEETKAKESFVKNRTSILRNHRNRQKVIRRDTRIPFRNSRESGTVIDTDSDDPDTNGRLPEVGATGDSNVRDTDSSIPDLGSSTTHQSRDQPPEVREPDNCPCASTSDGRPTSDTSTGGGGGPAVRTHSLPTHLAVGNRPRVVSLYPEEFDNPDRQRVPSIFPPGYEEEFGIGGSDDEIEEFHADYSDHPACISREDSVSDDIIRQKQKQETKRYMLAEELMTTEDSYVAKLSMLNVMKLRVRREVGEAQAKELLQDIEVIWRLHSENLLPTLKERISKWSEKSQIGDVMQVVSPYLKLYTNYVKNFQSAAKLVQRYHKHAAFRRIVRDFTGKSNMGMDIGALLIEPIQRIPRYRLLLKEYQKYLPDDHDDKELIEGSLKMISDVAEHFEEVLARDDNISRLRALHDSLGGAFNIFNLSRRLLTQAECDVCNTKEQCELCTIFLISDLLLLTKDYQKVPLKRRVLHIGDLTKSKVEPNPDPDSKFSLVLFTRRSRVVLFFRNEKITRDWENMLRKQIVESNKRKLIRRGKWKDVHTLGCSKEMLGKEPPTKIPTIIVPICLVRGCQFKSLKHKEHCDACGLVVCRRCSGNKLQLEYDHTEKKRVCDTCHKALVLYRTASI